MGSCAPRDATETSTCIAERCSMSDQRLVSTAQWRTADTSSGCIAELGPRRTATTARCSSVLKRKRVSVCQPHTHLVIQRQNEQRARHTRRTRTTLAASKGSHLRGPSAKKQRTATRSGEMMVGSNGWCAHNRNKASQVDTATGNCTAQAAQRGAVAGAAPARSHTRQARVAAMT
jgi:hypothetical protein